jgi:hypothetical protein
VATPAAAQAPRGDFPTRPISFVVGLSLAEAQMCSRAL